MAVINNQGYRRDLNLEETPDDGGAFDNLAGAGAASDIRLLQNNLRNTSRVGFNTISNNFFSFAFDTSITNSFARGLMSSRNISSPA